MEAALSDQPDFGKIDWQAPWLQDLGAFQMHAGSTWRAALNRIADQSKLTSAAGMPLHFTEQHALPDGAAYEAHIAATGGVPTRANLHDFFNALIWLKYPQIKRRLNALQAQELARDGVQGVRGKLRDRATLFDENAALFVSDDAEAIAALCGHNWPGLFLERRERYGKTWSVFPFGHALLEKLTTPFKAITAHAWVMPVEPAFFKLPREEQCNWLDAQLALEIQHGLGSRDFTPLPVLGVPGWAAEQNEAYYLDRSVFRPKRTKASLEQQ